MIAAVSPIALQHTYEGFFVLLIVALTGSGLLAHRHSVHLVKAVRAARRQHALFRAAAETSQSAFYLCKPVRRGRRIVDFRLLYGNREAAEMFHLTRRELRRKRLSTLLPKATRAEVLSSWARVIATANSEDVTMQVAAADGPDHAYTTRVVKFDGGVAVSALRPCHDRTSLLPKTSVGHPELAAALNSLPVEAQGNLHHALIAESVQRMAQHDHLTGLPNRALLTARLTQEIESARASGTSVAIYMVDIDNFTRINDSLGHDGGDALLVAFARHLVSAVLPGDAVVRAGGDEFVVITPRVRDSAAAAQCAELILTRAATPVMVGGHEVRVTASVGYCVYPDCSLEVADLLRQADLAMHEAKSTGPGTYLAFRPEMEKEAGESLKMEEELRHGFNNGELQLHYQPQVHCSTGEVTGMEALMRWTSPTRGTVPPIAFIPVAENAGLMIEIGEWVLRQACHDCVQLQRSTGKPLTVAVNLSPRQFNQRNLPSLVKEALEESGLSPGHLELEITEQMLMASTPCVMDTLAQMRQLGVKLAIDDFGTGFSSFAYIMQYHVDRLKIDRSFISEANDDPAAAAVVRAIIGMAHGLNMDVVAEGVENEDLLKFLMGKKCDDAQGYLFSKAVSLKDFPAALAGIGAWAQSARTAQGALQHLPDVTSDPVPLVM